jgi:tyrosine-protein kinase Etk/Wzc
VGLWIAEFNVPLAYQNKNFVLTAIDSQNFKLISPDGAEFTGKVATASRFKTSAGNIDIQVTSLAPGYSYNLSKLTPAKAIDNLRANLAVAEKGKQTGILDASLTGANQDEITHTLTRIVKMYETQNLDKSSAETTKTLAFMQEQLPKLKAKLAEAEAQFNKFREQNATVDIDKEAELAVTQRATIETNLRELELKRAELSERYTDEYPVLKQLNMQIQALKDKENSLQQTITRIPEVQRQFLELSSDVKISNEIYLNMLKNYEQLQIVKSGQLGNVRIIDLPINTYEPIAPKKAQIVLIATLLGLMLGIGLAFLKSLLFAGVKNLEELENNTDIPVIGVIPHSPRLTRLLKSKSTKIPLVEKIEPEGIVSEGFKSIRTHLLFNATKTDGNTLLVTGAGPGIGKSFIAANLAVAMAMTGKRVLLIDADARLGHLHDRFNLPNINGLVDYLVDDTVDAANSSYMIQTTLYKNLHFIPRGKGHSHASELLLGRKMKALLNFYRQFYDYIIIDTSPVLGTSDAQSLGQLVDSVLFVARYDISTVKQINYSIERLQRANVKVEGIIFNDAKQSIIGKYNDQYGYEYKSKN